MRFAISIRPVLALLLLLPSLAFAQTARVQVIHNSPDPAAAAVDVYIDGALALDNFKFRKATPYLDLPAGVPVEVAIAPRRSRSASDALATFTYTLQANRNYQLVATGVLDPGAFAANPDGRSTAFTLLVNAPARTSSTAGTFRVKVVHGAPDAPRVDITARGLPRLAQLYYGDQTNNYGQLTTQDYIVDVAPANSGTPIATFDATLPMLTDLDGLGGLILASGFLDPSANQNGPAFGLLSVSPTGQTRLIPAYIAPPPSRTASVQTAPGTFALHGAYPNPFNPTTQLRFDLPAEATVSIALYDLLGRQVLALAPKTMSAGAQQVTLDGSALSTGLYVYRLQAVTANETFVRSGRLSLLK